MTHTIESAVTIDKSHFSTSKKIHKGCLIKQIMTIRHDEYDKFTYSINI